jgi:two-component sensor histidine kinase
MVRMSGKPTPMEPEVLPARSQAPGSRTSQKAPAESADLPAVFEEGDEPAPSLDIFDSHEPNSVFNLVPERVQRAMNNLPDELRNLDEKSLREKTRPSATDSRLRVAFWNEYERSQKFARPMVMANVFAGICSKQFFFEKYIARPENVAWMLCPVVSYMKAAEECLIFGIEQMREVLELPNVDAKGKVNTSLIAQKRAIVQSLENRIKGAIPLVQKNLNINAQLTDKAAAQVAQQAVTQMSMSQVQDRLAKLKRKRERMLASGTPVGMEATNEEDSAGQGDAAHEG